MYEKRGVAASAQQPANEQLPERDSRYMRYHQTAEYPCRETYIRNRCACQQGFNGICRQNAWTYGHQDNQNICTDSGQDRVRRNERDEKQIHTLIKPESTGHYLSSSFLAAKIVVFQVGPARRPKGRLLVKKSSSR